MGPPSEVVDTRSLWPPEMVGCVPAQILQNTEQIACKHFTQNLNGNSTLCNAPPPRYSERGRRSWCGRHLQCQNLAQRTFGKYRSKMSCTIPELWRHMRRKRGKVAADLEAPWAYSWRSIAPGARRVSGDEGGVDRVSGMAGGGGCLTSTRP